MGFNNIYESFLQIPVYPVIYFLWPLESLDYLGALTLGKVDPLVSLQIKVCQQMTHVISAGFCVAFPNLLLLFSVGC